MRQYGTWEKSNALNSYFTPKRVIITEIIVITNIIITTMEILKTFVTVNNIVFRSEIIVLLLDMLQIIRFSYNKKNRQKRLPQLCRPIIILIVKKYKSISMYTGTNSRSS